MGFAIGVLLGGFVVWAIMRPAAQAHLPPDNGGLTKTDSWKDTYRKRR